MLYIKRGMINQTNSWSDGGKNFKIPIAGFGTEFKDYDAIIEKIINKIMDDEGLCLRDFIIRRIPELSSEGGIREMYAEAKNLKIGKLEDDELNKGKKKIKISFILDKGCYATEFIKQLFVQ